MSIQYCNDRFPPECVEPCKYGGYINPAIAWADQSMALVIDHFMLLCTSYGLATLAMGGFDKKKVSEVLNIPNTYVPELVLAVGYAAPEAHHYISKRYSPDLLVYEDEFDKKYEGIPVPNIKLENKST